MDIGTAKIRKEEMQGIKHYLIDEFEPWEEFNVKIFKEKCGSVSCIAEITFVLERI